MKKHLSILMLAARGTVCKLACLITIMGAAQVVFFSLTLRGDEVLGLEQTISRSRIALVCGVCFLLLCALLSLTGCELRGSKLRYTIGRLRVGERTLTIWWSAYNTACFIIFWAAELAIVLILCRIYMTRGDAQHVSGQTIFLAAYRSGFFHSLLPLEETSRFVRNIFLAIGLGISSACFSYHMRRGKRGAAIIFMAAVTAVFFAGEMGSFAGDMLLSILSAAVAAISISRLWGVNYDEA